MVFYRGTKGISLASKHKTVVLYGVAEIGGVDLGTL